MRKIINFFCILLLAVSTNAATLTCQFQLGSIPSLPVCTIQSLQVTQVNEVINVANPPFPNYYDNQTMSLFLDSSSSQIVINEFPKIFGIFTNIQMFSAHNISVTELSTDAFYNCKQLSNIDIQYSVLGNIRARFASTCPFIRSVHIYYSKVLSIDQDAFVGMTGLDWLTIYQSGLTCIPPRLFHPLIGVRNLMFSNNNLTALHSQAFKGLFMVDQVDFSNNQIKYLPCFDLTNTGHGGMGGSSHFGINLYNNPIRAICPTLITSLFTGGTVDNDETVNIMFQQQSTQEISCIDPNIQSFISNVFSGDLYSIGMNSLEWVRQDLVYRDYTTCYSDFTPQMASESLVTCGTFVTTTTPRSTTVGNGSGGSGSGGQCATDKICRFYLDWNDQYTCVIDGAEGTSITGTHYLTYTNADVKRVYFINSYLSLVPKILFQTFPGLKFLHTANSGMTVINDQTFNECGQLELWDASDNDISQVDETSLRNCTSLRIIDLTGNPIDFVSQGLYEVDPALERIHLLRLDDWTLA